MCRNSGTIFSGTTLILFSLISSHPPSYTIQTGALDAYAKNVLLFSRIADARMPAKTASNGRTGNLSIVSQSIIDWCFSTTLMQNHISESPGAFETTGSLAYVCNCVFLRERNTILFSKVLKVRALRGSSQGKVQPLLTTCISPLDRKHWIYLSFVDENAKNRPVSKCRPE